MERVIVTGGAGFIGANLVHHLLASTPAHVTVLDKLTYAGHLESLADVADHPRYAFLRGDIADRATVRRLFSDFKPTAVFNLAAESHVDRSIDGPDAFVRTNVVGTFELLEAARGYLAESDNARRAAFRFLHVSTDEVFGSLGETGSFSEDTPYAPNSPYAASKAAADHLVRAYYETYRLPAIVTNCSNNFGPFQFPEKLIPLMILNAIDGKQLPIYGDGRNVRDWLFVADHCAGLLLAITAGQPGEKYNIGGGNERTNLEIVDRVCTLLDELLPARDNPALAGRGIDSYSELKKFVADRPGHDRRYAIDASKVRRQLGWAPVHRFETGLEATVRWYLANRDWCSSVQQGGGYERGRLGLGSASS